MQSFREGGSALTPADFKLHADRSTDKSELSQSEQDLGHKKDKMPHVSRVQRNSRVPVLGLWAPVLGTGPQTGVGLWPRKHVGGDWGSVPSSQQVALYICVSRPLNRSDAPAVRPEEPE